MAWQSILGLGAEKLRLQVFKKLVSFELSFRFGLKPLGPLGSLGSGAFALDLALALRIFPQRLERVMSFGSESSDALSRP